MNRSESIDKVAAAIVAVQAEIRNPIKDATNPHFKSGFASLPAILSYVRPVLEKHGLAVLQVAAGEDGRAGCATVLLHRSGQFIASDVLLMKDRKDDAQGLGSALTYSRRYSLCALLNIAADDDDDGNQAVSPPPAKKKGTVQTFAYFMKHFKDAESKAELLRFDAQARELDWTQKHGEELLDTVEARLKEFQDAAPDVDFRN